MTKSMSVPKQCEKAADDAVKLALSQGAIVRNDTGLLCLPVATEERVDLGDEDPLDEHAGDDRSAAAE